MVAVGVSAITEPTKTFPMKQLKPSLDQKLRQRNFLSDQAASQHTVQHVIILLTYVHEFAEFLPAHIIDLKH